MGERNASMPTMKGGTKDFNWQGVKNMSYRDRESYLGSTVRIGFLEKGARWNKSDWWLHGKNQNHESKTGINDEIQKQKAEDEKMMRIALGLEEREEEYNLPKMTAEEAKYMTDKMKMDAEEEGPDDHREILPGLGYKATNVNLNKDRSKRAMKDFDSALRLEGVGMDELMKIEQEKAEKLKRLEESHKLKENERKSRPDDGDSIFIRSKKIKKDSSKGKKKKDKKEKKKRKKEKSRRKKAQREKERLYKLYKV